jgi:6-pyruvoyltetrahydropterin/6-carboxytetrahydropterin synthase
MHKLSRRVRFSINPFLPSDSRGSNSLSSKPAAEGLAIFLELSVELVGSVEPTTGFVVNVLDIDKMVRKYVVPIFSERIRKDFRKCKHISLFDIAELLKTSRQKLADKFGTAKVNKLSLNLNPFRKVAVDCEETGEECKMIYFSEKFEFAAMHRLWNDDFSQSRNFEVFGKCANPAGHGHNYIVEVTVKTPAEKGQLRIGDFERTVDNNLIKLLDHKNLNADVEQLGTTNPTVENLAVFAWNRLVGKFGAALLHCVTVWENDRTCSSYLGGV